MMHGQTQIKFTKAKSFRKMKPYKNYFILAGQKSSIAGYRIERCGSILCRYFSPSHFLCSADRASLYNLVNETNLIHYFFLMFFVNLIYNLYMFRTSPGPSSGGTTVFTRHLALILYRWLSGMQEHMLLHTRHSAIQS